MSGSSPPLSRVPATLMACPSHTPSDWAPRRLVLRLPHYSLQDEAAESPQFKNNTRHLTQRAWDGHHDLLSLLFLRFILPDSAVEHVLVYITSAFRQLPPQILRNEPCAAADDEGADDAGCYEARLEPRDPDAAAAYPFPPLPTTASVPPADPRSI